MAAVNDDMRKDSRIFVGLEVCIKTSLELLSDILIGMSTKHRYNLDVVLISSTQI